MGVRHSWSRGPVQILLVGSESWGRSCWMGLRQLQTSSAVHPRKGAFPWDPASISWKVPTHFVHPSHLLHLHCFQGQLWTCAVRWVQVKKSPISLQMYWPGSELMILILTLIILWFYDSNLTDLRCLLRCCCIKQEQKTGMWTNTLVVNNDGKRRWGF